MNTPPLPAKLGPSDGQCFSAAGDVYRTLVSGAQTGGAFVLVEVRIPPGGGPPPHVHRREDETFYVLEGRVGFWLNGETIEAGPGSCVFAPRNIPHRFFNPGDQHARMLVTASPAGLEDFFREFATPVSSIDAHPAPVGPEVIARLMQAAPRFGIEILPPA